MKQEIKVNGQEGMIIAEVLVSSKQRRKCLTGRDLGEMESKFIG